MAKDVKIYLQYQINEIESANLREGEEEELTRERDRLINAEKIINIVNSVYQDIYSGSGNIPFCF